MGGARHCAHSGARQAEVPPPGAASRLSKWPSFLIKASASGVEVLREDDELLTKVTERGDRLPVPNPDPNTPHNCRTFESNSNRPELQLAANSTGRIDKRRESSGGLLRGLLSPKLNVITATPGPAMPETPSRPRLDSL